MVRVDMMTGMRSETDPKSGMTACSEDIRRASPSIRNAAAPCASVLPDGDEEKSRESAQKDQNSPRRDDAVNEQISE